MWQDYFRISNVSVGEVRLNSMAELGDYLKTRGIEDERAILLRTKVNKRDILITDEFEGVFLQEGFHFILSSKSQLRIDYPGKPKVTYASHLEGLIPKISKIHIS